MSVLGLLWFLLAFFWVQYLPGYLLSRKLVPDATGLERHGLALLAGFSTVPLAVFLLSVGASLPMDRSLLLVASTGLNLGLGYAVFGSQTGPRLDVTRRDLGELLIIAVSSAVLLLFGIRSLDGGDIFSTVHHCLYVIAMYAVGNHVDASIPLWDSVSGDVMHYLIQHPTSEFNGLAPLFYEQRIGNAPIVAPPVALYGTAGWLISPIFAATLMGVCVTLAARNLGVRRWPSLLAGVIFALGMQIFCGYSINENTFAVALVAFLVLAATRSRLSPGWLVLVGITAGHLVGVRYTSALFWPAVLAMVLWQPGAWRERLRGLAIAGGPAILAALPWLYINFIMLGNPVGHPKVHSAFAARMVTNTVFGFSFRFRALNWPFTDGWVRTPWNAFPTLLWLPLWTSKAFGQLTTALALAGWVRAWRHRRAFWLLLLFAVPHTLAIGSLETLDWEQLTYATPGLVPMGVVLGLGFDGLWPSEDRRRHLILAAGAIVLVIGGSLGLRSLRFEIDGRRLAEVGCVPATGESEGVVATREWLTAPSPFPKWPAWGTRLAGDTWDALAVAGPWAGQTDTRDGLGVYPSGQTAILSAYSADGVQSYEFFMDGGPLRTASTPVRTSLGLHQVSVQLPATQVHFTVSRGAGEGDAGSVGEDFDVAVRITEPSETLHDFTLWIHPWSPPVRNINGWLEGGRDGGSAAFTTLIYGSREAGEQRFIVTNYPPEVLDVVDLEVRVDPQGAPAHWGLLFFAHGTDPTRIESLVLSGGHDHGWTGEGIGEPMRLRIPTGLMAEHLILHVEPFCSDHVPQYGDRYGVVRGPFRADQPVTITIDKRW